MYEFLIKSQKLEGESNPNFIQRKHVAKQVKLTPLVNKVYAPIINHHYPKCTPTFGPKSDTRTLILMTQDVHN